MSLLDLAGLLALLAFWFGMLYFAKSLKRIENAADRMEAAAAVVANDLAASHERADNAPSMPPGGAADAAMRTER